MPASSITHGLKVLGGGMKMWLGILVVFVVGAAVGAIAMKLLPRRA
jgi:hypothetical protein